MGKASLPIIAITMGDPAGIGPEIVVKALTDESVYRVCRPVVIGDIHAMERARTYCSLSRTFRVIDNLDDLSADAASIDLLAVNVPHGDTLPIGEVDATCGRIANACIERATQLAMTGEVAAIATAPINKQSLRAAGISHIGHTEIIGDLAGVDDPQTMFEIGTLRIFFATRHLSLLDACSAITEALVFEKIVRCIDGLAQLGIKSGTLAVAALNPHAGDGGLLGREEIEAIEPAIARAQAAGMQVEGPIAADSVFFLAKQGRYEAVLSLYHDQGHIAAKSIDHEHTIALTLGLPFLRTSVDHGTAFEIAGTGQASAVSMVESIVAAARYC